MRLYLILINYGLEIIYCKICRKGRYLFEKFLVNLGVNKGSLRKEKLINDKR